jgi:hypothetical protein
VVEVDVGTVFVVDVEVEVGDVIDVVVGPQGHSREMSRPTALFRHASASEDVIPPTALTSQTHTGEQVDNSSAARRMKRQSLAIGVAPDVTG